jgi:uracil-DNA glycosylase
MIRSDPASTRTRVERLNVYAQSQILAGVDFVCSHLSECRGSRAHHAFYDGQLSHVGRHFDLEVGGCPTRIVIVGQEYGTGETRCDLARRSSMIAASAKATFRGRNPHMKGTALTLRLLLGREPGTDADGERLLDGHVFDGFALVNFLLCSALKQERGEFDGGAGKGDSSRIMRRNCGRHFLRTLEILEPTVVVVQGQGVRRWLANALQLPSVGPVVEKAYIGGRTVDILTFNHPSARGYAGYRSPDALYLRQTVAPTIRNYLNSFCPNQ